MVTQVNMEYFDISKQPCNWEFFYYELPLSVFSTFVQAAQLMLIFSIF